MANTIKHKTHKYKRGKLGKTTTIYKCSIPGCSHYLYPETVLNKVSICNKCEKEFVMPSKVGQLKASPVCPDCSNTTVLDPIVEKTIDILLGVG